MDVSVDLTKMVKLGEGSFGTVFRAPMEKTNGEHLNVSYFVICIVSELVEGAAI